MSNAPAALKLDAPSSATTGQDSSEAVQRPAVDLATMLKVTKTKQLFVRLEISWKRFGARSRKYAAEPQPTHGEPQVGQPVLAFGAGRQPALALESLDAPAPAPGDTGSGSSGSTVSITGSVGTTVTPPDGWPPP